MNFEGSPTKIDRKYWWRAKRCKYNIGLIIAGFIAFVLYCVLGEIFITPREEFEVTIFTMTFQGIAYVVMMCVANIFYTLGWIADLFFNTNNSQRFRERLFAFGFWFSFALPILFILIIIIRFL
jgi:hypothetical protein